MDKASMVYIMMSKIFKSDYLFWGPYLWANFISLKGPRFLEGQHSVPPEKTDSFKVSQNIHQGNAILKSLITFELILLLNSYAMD